MHDLFLILFRVSCAILIFGLFVPKYAIFWMQIKSRQRVAAVYGPAVLVLLILALVTTPKQQATTEAALTNAPLDISAAASSNPAQEQQFIDTIAKYAASYRKATSVVERTKIWRDREDAIAKLKIMGEQISGWSGHIKQIGLNPEGLAVVVLSIDNGITIRTNKDGFSDAQDHTLISQDSDLYSSILKLTPGAQVRFTGTMLKNSDTSEANGMIKPTYIVKFEKIEAQE